MIVFATILILGVYFFVVRLVARAVGRSARHKGIAPWKWQAPVWLAAYLLVFWDLVPMIVVHRSFCAKDGGFAIYKTVEQWIRENPDAAQSIKPLAQSIDELPREPEKGRSGTELVRRLNERFDLRTDRVRVSGLFPIWRKSFRIVETSTNTTIASLIDYQRGSPVSLGGEKAEKWWLYKEHCDIFASYHEASARFYGIANEVMNIDGGGQ